MTTIKNKIKFGLGHLRGGTKGGNGTLGRYLIFMITIFVVIFSGYKTAYASATTLNITGFETGDTSETNTTSGTLQVQSTTKRTGGYALEVNPTTTATGYIIMTKPDRTLFGVNTLYTRFYFRYATKPASNSEEIFVARAGLIVYQTKFTLRLDSNGNLSAYNKTGTTQLGSTGTTVLNSDTWYRIEVSVGTGSSAAYEVKIDGTTELSGTGDLYTGNNSRAYFGKFTNQNGNTVDFFYDDINIDSGQYPGAGAIEIMLPDGNGYYTGWTASSGEKFQRVDEIPPNGDTDYIYTSTNPDAYTASLEDSSTAGISDSINAVKGFFSGRYTGATSGGMALRLRSNTTDSDTTIANFYTGYRTLGSIYATDPQDGGAWTASRLDAVEVGNVNTVAEERRTSLLGVMVDFVTSGAAAEEAAPPVQIKGGVTIKGGMTVK